MRTMAPHGLQAERDVHRSTAWPRPASRSASRASARRSRRCISTGPGCASASRCASPRRRPTRSASSSSSAGRCPAPRSGSSTTPARPAPTACSATSRSAARTSPPATTARRRRRPRPAADGWLDTGDLGLLSDGQLVVTGRAKDLVIVNGQNFYPHDFERVAQQVAGRRRQPGRRRRRAPGRTSEGEGLALFVLHRGELEGFVAKARAIRRAIAEQTGVEVAARRSGGADPEDHQRQAAALPARPGLRGRASSRRSWPARTVVWHRPTRAGRPVGAGLDPGPAAGDLPTCCTGPTDRARRRTCSKST